MAQQRLRPLFKKELRSDMVGSDHGDGPYIPVVILYSKLSPESTNISQQTNIDV